MKLSRRAFLGASAATGAALSLPLSAFMPKEEIPIYKRLVDKMSEFVESCRAAGIAGVSECSMTCKSLSCTHCLARKAFASYERLYTVSTAPQKVDLSVGAGHPCRNHLPVAIAYYKDHKPLYAASFELLARLGQLLESRLLVGYSPSMELRAYGDDSIIMTLGILLPEHIRISGNGGAPELPSEISFDY